MSASTIARWDAIPMTRELNPAPSNKRSRSDDVDASSDDNVSLVSRSPSPQPAQDMEMKDVYSYDEHVPGVAREVITVETRINNTNKGFTMLARMGWTEGSPLGISGHGRVDPIPFTVKQDSTGLGKVTQDFRMIETTVSQRRNLDSERMQCETAEQRQQREAAVAQKAAVQSEISNVLRPFYCELCDKQFKTVAQYDEHTNSYAHHHRARARDMNANHPVRVGGREEAERRKEKERKREEKELRRLAKAVGIKISTPPVASPPVTAENKGFKATGFVTVDDASSSTSVVPTPPMSSSSSGWAPVSVAPPAPGNSPLPLPSSADGPPPISAAYSNGFRSGGWSTLVTSFMEAPPSMSKGAWASVNTPITPAPPAPTVPTDPHPPPTPSGFPPPPPPQSFPPPPPGLPSSSWSCTPPMSQQHDNTSPAGSGNWDVRSPADSNASSNPLHPSSHSQTPQNLDINLNPRSKPKHKQKPTFNDEAPAQSRGNWQSFQKMRGRR